MNIADNRMQETLDAWEDYASRVESGAQVACGYLKQSVARYRRLQHDDTVTFRRDRVQIVIDFFHLLRHFKGRHAGGPFTLEPWQQFIVAYVFGFYRGGRRVVRHVYIEMARKNGKTAFAAALCLYATLVDGEGGAEVDLAANSKEQAKIAFEFASNFAKGIDGKGKYLRAFRDRIYYDRTVSKMQVFAADDTKLDGFNASVYLLDEYHAAKNSRMRDVLESSQGMRENPLGIIITTAGFDRLSPCFQYRTMCTELLAGVREDDTTAAFIYTLDEGDRWDDPQVWIKSNPNMGVTVKVDYIQEQVTQAKNLPSSEIGVRTKNINEWCDAQEVWIPDKFILESTKRLKADDYEDCLCYAGVDLSSTSDLTALALCFPMDDGTYHFMARYYLPESALGVARFRELYGEWARRGWLTLTPGNVTDYNFILNDLLECGRRYRIVRVAYDAWNATQFTVEALSNGVNMEEFSQSLGNFNRPTKEFERLCLGGRIVLDGNGITRHCFRNVQLVRDHNGNTKPSKSNPEKKIDGVIAILESLGAAIVDVRYDNTI